MTLQQLHRVYAPPTLVDLEEQLLDVRRALYGQVIHTYRRMQAERKYRDHIARRGEVTYLLAHAAAEAERAHLLALLDAWHVAEPKKVAA